MIKRILSWLDELLTPAKTKTEEKLIERHYLKFCEELKTYPQKEQIFIKDTILRMFSGIAIGEY